MYTEQRLSCLARYRYVGKYSGSDLEKTPLTTCDGGLLSRGSMLDVIPRIDHWA